MPERDLKSLRRTVNSIIANIEVYRKDIERSMKLLKDSYDIDNPEHIDKMINELEDRRDKLDQKKDNLISKANAQLKGIPNE